MRHDEKSISSKVCQRMFVFRGFGNVTSSVPWNNKVQL